MSDLNGTDVHIHGGRPGGLFSEPVNAFIRQRSATGVERMNHVFLGLKEGMPGLLRKVGTKSSLKARVFDDLRVLAGALSA